MHRKLKTDWGDAGVEKSLDPGGGMGKVFNGGLWAIVRTELTVYSPFAGGRPKT